MSRAADISFAEVGAALGLVAVAVAVSLWQRMRLEGDIGIAVARSFVQLTAVGFVIQLVFAGDSILLVVALIAAMAVFGAFTARGRAPSVPHAFVPLLIALGLAGTATLVLVVALGVFSAEPRYLVPIGGMVVGNSMTAAAVALGRLGDEVTGSRREIEATLALGATATQAARPIVRRSLRSGVTPLIDSTKTTGVIFFPGIMVGLLVAGASPLDAVRLQLIILYMLLGSVAIASVTAVVLAQRNFFTGAHQLREAPTFAPAERRSAAFLRRRILRRGTGTPAAPSESPRQEAGDVEDRTDGAGGRREPGEPGPGRERADGRARGQGRR